MRQQALPSRPVRGQHEGPRQAAILVGTSMIHSYRRNFGI